MVGAQGMVGARLGHSWGMVGAQGMLGARLGKGWVMIEAWFHYS